MSNPTTNSALLQFGQQLLVAGVSALLASQITLARHEQKITSLEKAVDDSEARLTAQIMELRSVMLKKDR